MIYWLISRHFCPPIILEAASDRSLKNALAFNTKYYPRYLWAPSF